VRDVARESAAAKPAMCSPSRRDEVAASPVNHMCIFTILTIMSKLSIFNENRLGCDLSSPTMLLFIIFMFVSRAYEDFVCGVDGLVKRG